MQMNIPFFKDLKAPIYKKRVFSGKEKPCENEFAITSNWDIVIPEEISPQIVVSSNDLREFLRVNAGIELPVVKSDSIQRSQKKHIFLRIKEHLSKTKPESYTIKCSPDGVSIEGVDDSGLMYGVFYLEELMKFRKAPILKYQNVKRSPILETRIFRSPMAFYYQEELLQINDAYPDNYLLKLAHHGFNGIWLRGILRDLVKTDIFPELGKDSEKLLKNLNTLIKRCAKFGIKVYFYFTEPLAFKKDSEFWKKYPHLKGEPHKEFYALCTSNKEVKEYLKEGMKYLFKNAKGLGGVILITASEHHTHCYSHVDLRNALNLGKSKISCKKCKKRTPQEVVGEIITLINSGVKSVAPDAKVIAWNWSWSMYEKDPQKGIIEKIPEDVIIMGDFERGGERTIDGFKHVVDEYSLSYVGPSERFRGTAQLARKLGHEIYAKLQIGVTHEIATVPYFPVLYKLAQKFLNLKKEGGTGAMECWNFGNILSRNTELANWFSWKPLPENIDEILTKIAIRDFGEEAGRSFVKAWEYFSKATDYFPFDIQFVYWGPQNFGGAYPLFLKKKNVHMPVPWLLPKEVKYNNIFSDWLMKRTEFGDRLDDFCKVFGPERVTKNLKLLCKEWRKGVSLIKESLNLVPKELKENAEKEYIVSAAILSQFTSTVNFVEFTYLRDKMYEEKNNRKKEMILEKLKDIAKDEIKNSLFLKKLASEDNTLGFHGEAFGYMYTPEKIDRKIRIVIKLV